jgi:hypothetical protein
MTKKEQIDGFKREIEDMKRSNGFDNAEIKKIRETLKANPGFSKDTKANYNNIIKSRQNSIKQRNEKIKIKQEQIARMKNS